MMGIRRVSDAEREIGNTLIDKAKLAKEALIQKRKQQKRAYNATEIRLERKKTEMHSTKIFSDVLLTDWQKDNYWENCMKITNICGDLSIAVC